MNTIIFIISKPTIAAAMGTVGAFLACCPGCAG